MRKHLAQTATSAAVLIAGFVETHDVVRPEKESPAGEGYREFKNAETGSLLGNAFGNAMLKLIK